MKLERIQIPRGSLIMRLSAESYPIADAPRGGLVFANSHHLIKHTRISKKSFAVNGYATKDYYFWCAWGKWFASKNTS